MRHAEEYPDLPHAAAEPRRWHSRSAETAATSGNGRLPPVKTGAGRADFLSVTLTASLERGVLGEDATDLRSYLRTLTGCPPVTHTFSLRCDQHGADAGNWFYVEADPQTGIARRRCMACGQVTAMLDSNQHWTYPAMHSCAGCGQSLMELAVGMHATAEADVAEVEWLALAGRCVACGRIDGLTDVCVDKLPVHDLADRI